MLKFAKFFLCCFFLSYGLFADHDQFGLNTNDFPAEPQQYEGSPQRVYFEQLNIQWIRSGIDWKDIEKPLGRFDFTAVDKIVDYAQRNNINILFILGAAPFEYRRVNPLSLYYDYINPIHIDKWAAFVTAMVNRYKTVIKYWEVWNEPNCVDGNWETKANEFVDLILIPGIAAIRAADPQAKICGPALLSNKPGDNNHMKWLDLITQRGVVFDVLTYHQYHGGNSALGRFNALKEFHDHADSICGYAGKPFWLTETGWKVDNSEGNAVLNMHEMLQYMLANKNWWNKTFWFAYRDTNDIYPLIDYQTDEPYPHYYTFKSYTNPPYITVISPNGGEIWPRGSTQTIRWSSNEVANVSIELLKGTIVDATITPSVAAPTGSYSWVIPSTKTIGNDYRINICRVAGNNNERNLCDSSNTNFSITDPAIISVDLGKTDIVKGISRPKIEPGDGVTLPVLITTASGGSVYLRQNKQVSSHYLYFCVDDNFIFQGKGAGNWTKIRVRVQYWDRNVTGWSPTMTLQYDSPTGSYTNGGTVTVGNTKYMKAVDFIINKANVYFGNRQNGGADFRLACGSGSSLKYINTVFIYKE